MRAASSRLQVGAQRLWQVLVGGGGEEVGEVGAEDYLAEDGGGVVEGGAGTGATVIIVVAGAEFLGYLVVLLLEVVFKEGGVDAAAVVELGAVV